MKRKVSKIDFRFSNQKLLRNIEVSHITEQYYFRSNNMSLVEEVDLYVFSIKKPISICCEQN